MSIVMILLAVWNATVFLVYGADKLRARKGLRRIKEKNLITISFLFGSIGAMFGMVIFNHKTSKTKFRALVPLSVVFNAVAVCAINYILKII